ncbi:MAG: hypothetical protein AAF899_05090 [Pseudomonadota bacterium]
MSDALSASGTTQTPKAGDDPADARRRAFLADGFLRFDHDPALADWVAALRPYARRLARDPALNAAWLRCGESWFAGVNVLQASGDGSVAEAGTGPLPGAAMAFVRAALGLDGIALDAGQLSVCWPGYPAAPAEGESAAAFRFRRDRDAAHVDGLERDAARRRRLSETHAFILGIPLEETPRAAAPLVVWQGSHHVIRQALSARLAQVPVADWAAEDVTDAYVAARRAVFDRCRRTELHANPGECYLVHRLAVHGVAPWPQTAPGAPHGRPIVYFRPEPWPAPHPERDYAWWLRAE